MRRRDWLALVAVAAACPGVAQAQSSGPLPRIGLLMASTAGDPAQDPRLVGFRAGLAERGWIEGRNIQLEIRATAAGAGQLGTLAHELVALRPTVLVGHTVAAASALRRETATVPIVGILIADPVANGLVANLARPGGNVTGFANFEPAIGGKWLSLLKETAPGVTRVGFIFNPSTSTVADYLRSAEQAARTLGVVVVAMKVHSETEIEPALAALGSQPGAGLIVPPDVFLATHDATLVALVAQHRVPTIYAYRRYADRGGLMVYGLDAPAVYRRAASYVDRILKGANPAELPVQYPTNFELVINLKAARQLGLTVPPAILARADEVIE